MSTRTDKFIKVLLENSNSNDYDIAFEEWKLDHLHYNEYGNGECICGQKNITNIVIIKNIVNNKSLEIGANCSKNNLNIYVDTTFYSEARGGIKLRKQREALFSKELIESSYQDKIINDWEYKFYNSLYTYKYDFTKSQKVYIKKVENKIKK